LCLGNAWILPEKPRTFTELYTFMNFEEAKDYILSRLKKELPKNLFYHGFHHTLDVCKAVDELAFSERINGEDLILLRTAAVFHDSGFLQQYLNNEPIAVSIAEQKLPAFNYSSEQIRKIGHVILSTCIPQRPTNHIEQIMCDADLDYLGRDDFFEISETLKQEWLAYGLISSDEEYNEKQLKFFQQHHYFTQTAKQKRELKKQKHLLELRTRV
jgi:uncharacterized protein